MQDYHSCFFYNFFYFLIRLMFKHNLKNQEQQQFEGEGSTAQLNDALEDFRYGLKAQSSYKKTQ
jgi:hypothetical protein